MPNHEVRHSKLWIFSLLLPPLFWGAYILFAPSALYTLRGFWQVLPLLLIPLFGYLFSFKALKWLKIAPLPRWQKFLIQMFLYLNSFYMMGFCITFFIGLMMGIISPNHYANYPSPSKQRSVTIVSYNITCTQEVYLNHGLIMQSVGSFQIGTAKCLNSARAKIQWQPGETAIVWKYRDRQGIISLPTD